MCVKKSKYNPLCVDCGLSFVRTIMGIRVRCKSCTRINRKVYMKKLWDKKKGVLVD